MDDPRPKTILDLGMRLHVPYNNDFGLIDAITPLARYIRSLYLPCNFEILSSGRYGGNTTIRNWRTYDREVRKIVTRLRPLGIHVNMLFNSTYVKPSTLQSFESSPLHTYLEERIADGIEWVTLANIELAKCVRRCFPSLKIDVSVLAFIDSVRRARYWQDLVRPNMICMDLDQGRNLPLIKSIGEMTGLPVKVLVNSFCLPECPYKSFHYIHFSLRESSPFTSCWEERSRRPWRFYAGRIVPPYYLRHYQGLIRDLKITDRSAPTPVIVRLIRYYAEELESKHYVPDRGETTGASGLPEIGYNVQRPYYEHNARHPWLMELPENVFDKTGTCDRNCHQCNFCYQTWQRQWSVNEDLPALQDFIARTARSADERRYYEDLLLSLHYQRHNVPFVRHLRNVLAYTDPAFADLFHYLRALAYHEAREDALADKYLVLVRDPPLQKVLRACLESTRDAPVIRYLDFDDQDPESFQYLARLRREQGVDALARRAETYLKLGESEQALPLIEAIGNDPELLDRLIDVAFRNKRYPLTITLLERKTAELDVPDQIRWAWALFRLSRPWKQRLYRVRMGSLKGVHLDPVLQFYYLKLLLAEGRVPPGAIPLDPLLTLAGRLQRNHDLALAAEVLQTLLVLDPDHVAGLRRYQTVLREMNRMEEAAAMTRRIAAIHEKHAAQLERASRAERPQDHHFGLSEVYFAMRDFEAAARHARQAVTADASLSDGWLRLLDCLGKLDDREELAIAQREHLLALATAGKELPRPARSGSGLGHAQ